MTKRIMFSLSSMVLLSASLFVGCTSPNNHTKANVAVIYGNVQNSPHVNTSELKEYVLKSCYTSGNVSFIVPDGEPFVAYKTAIPEPKKKYSSEKLTQIAEGYTSKVLSKVSEAAIPKTEETNFIASLNISAREIEAQRTEDSDNYLAVFYSGVSTEGALNMQNCSSISNINVEETVKTLRKSNSLPSLERVNVIHYYLGDTTAPQTSLNESEKAHLKALYQAIYESCGAASIEFRADVPVSTEPDYTLPKVSVVNTDSVESMISSYTGKEEIVMDDSIISFQKNSDALVNEISVKDNLIGIAEFLINNPSEQILVVGTTAHHGTKEYCIGLSKKRCDKIRQLLLNLGVSSNQVHIIGLGYDNPWHQDNYDSRGKFVEEIAQKNRKTVIVNYNSTRAKEILKERSVL